MMEGAMNFMDGTAGLHPVLAGSIDQWFFQQAMIRAAEWKRFAAACSRAHWEPPTRSDTYLILTAENGQLGLSCIIPGGEIERQMKAGLN